jgi:hypothetical protein
MNKRHSTDPEQQVPRSPAKAMTREWATASYDSRTGRPNIFMDGGAKDKQVPNAGRHTIGNNLKGRSRPGRW